MYQSPNIASVSVIIPCYRHVETLERAVTSVVEQSLPVMEVIIVNDGADLKVQEAVEVLQAKFRYSFIKLVSLPINVGAGEARNAGWNVAKGQFIAFLDADDAWHPQKISIQYNFMTSNPHIALTGHRHRQEEGQPDWQRYDMSQVFSSVGLSKFLLFNQFITPSVMIQNSPDFRFAKNQRHMEDFGLWLSVALKGRGIVKLEAELACIFKDPFGESGLSANLFKMEQGELSVYWNAAKYQPFLFPGLLVLYPFSMLKFLRRIFLKFIRRH